MNEEELYEFRRWMDYLTPLLNECVDTTSWDLYYSYGYPFDEWFLGGYSDEDILQIICEDMRV
jgi:hypothetical protein